MATDPQITYADYHPDDYIESDKGKREEPPMLTPGDEAILDDVNDRVGREMQEDDAEQWQAVW